MTNLHPVIMKMIRDSYRRTGNMLDDIDINMIDAAYRLGLDHGINGIPKSDLPR